MDDMTQVFLHGHNGHTFHLSGSLDFEGVVLRNPSGLVTPVSRDLRGRANGRGAEILSHIFSEMRGSLEVEILADESASMSLSEVWEAWKKGWATDRAGRLEVIPGGQRWSVPVILENNIETPTPGPSSPGIVQFTSTVSVLALDGIWSGETQMYTASATVTNPGTVTLHPVVYWTGSGQSITLPDGRVISLPTVNTEYSANLDPGSGFKVDGEFGAAVWAAFRGRDMRAPIPPGESRVFQLTSGVRLEATPLHENPWG